MTSAKSITLAPSTASLPHEMHSLATEAPPRPPNTALSVVIWIAARCGLAAPSPRIAFTLVAVICRKSLGTPPPRKIAEVPGPGGM